MTWALLALALVAAPPAKKKGASKKPAPASAATDAAIKSALDAEQQKIADCVVADAPSSGVWAKTVKATVKINSAGQVLAADVTLEPDGPPSTRACIEKVLRAVAYPKSTGPLISITRDWSFAMK